MRRVPRFQVFIEIPGCPFESQSDFAREFALASGTMKDSSANAAISLAMSSKSISTANLRCAYKAIETRCESRDLPEEQTNALKGAFGNLFEIRSGPDPDKALLGHGDDEHNGVHVNGSNPTPISLVGSGLTAPVNGNLCAPNQAAHISPGVRLLASDHGENEGTIDPRLWNIGTSILIQVLLPIQTALDALDFDPSERVIRMLVYESMAAQTSDLGYRILCSDNHTKGVMCERIRA